MININESDKYKMNLDNTASIINGKKMYCLSKMNNIFKGYDSNVLENIIRIEISTCFDNLDVHIMRDSVSTYDTRNNQVLSVVDMYGNNITSIYMDTDVLVVLIQFLDLSNKIKKGLSMKLLKDVYPNAGTVYNYLIGRMNQYIVEYNPREQAIASLRYEERAFRRVLSTTGRLNSPNIDSVDRMINDIIFGESVPEIVDNYNFEAEQIYQYSNPEAIYLKCAFMRAISTLVDNTKIHGTRVIKEEVKKMTPYVLNGTFENYINDTIDNYNCPKTMNQFTMNYINR